MRKGDIVIIPDTPCPGNDVLDVMRGNNDYPVYGVVRDYDPDDVEAAVFVHVIDQQGHTVEGGWWFKEEEVETIEESPDRLRPIGYRQDDVFQLGDEVAF